MNATNLDRYYDEVIDLHRHHLAVALDKGLFLEKKIVPLVVEGDSWFDYFPELSIVGRLRRDVWKNRYKIFGSPHYGAYLNDMVYNKGQLAETFRAIDEAKPQVFLFSGGGNDIAGDELLNLLWNKNSSARQKDDVVNKVIVDELIGNVFKQAYVDYVTLVRKYAEGIGIKKLPFVCHGYGNAIPDGRGWLCGAGLLPGPWLHPSLARKNWEKGGDDAQRKEGIRVMIERFNAMLQEVAATVPDFEYVDLRAELPDVLDWSNELHPSDRGFDKVTRVIEERICRLI